MENELTLQARRPWGKKEKNEEPIIFKEKKRQIQLNVSLKDCVDYKEGKELLQTYTYFPMAIEGEDLEAMPKYISSFLSGAQS